MTELSENRMLLDFTYEEILAMHTILLSTQDLTKFYPKDNEVRRIVDKMVERFTGLVKGITEQ